MTTLHLGFFIASLICGAGAITFTIFAWIADATTGKFIRKERIKWFIDAGVFYVIAIWLAILSR